MVLLNEISMIDGNTKNQTNNNGASNDRNMDLDLDDRCHQTRSNEDDNSVSREPF